MRYKTIFNNIDNSNNQVISVKDREDNDLWAEMISTNLETANNNACRFVQFIDISQRITTEKALKESEERYRLLSENGADFVALISETGRFLYASPSVTHILGYSAEELIGQSPYGFIHEDDRQQALDYHQQLLKNREIPVVEYRFKHKKGHDVWLETSLRSTTDDNGILRIITTSHNITQRKLYEEKLLQNEARHRFITENILDVIWIIDVETARFTYVSPSVEKLRGFTPEEVMNHTLEQAFTPESKQIVLQALPREVANFMAGKFNTFKEELEQYCKDGSTVWIEVIAYLRKNETTNRLEIIGTSRNVTDRHHAEVAKREIEKRYKLLTEVTNEAVIIHQNGTIVDVNPSLLRMFNQPNDPSLLVGKSIFSIISGDEADIVRSKVDTNYCGIYQITIHRTDNTSFPAEVNANLITVDGTSYRVVSINDITERKAAEKQLIESEALFRSIFDNAVAGIAMVDIKSNITMVNKAFCQIVGFEPNEILGKSFYNITHPDDIASEQALIDQALAKGHTHFRFEKRYISKNSAIVWADLSVAILRTSNNEAYAMVSVVNDITLKKQNELELMRMLELNQSINQTSPVGITTTDANGEITFANNLAISILGLSESDIVGKKYNSPSWVITELDGAAFDMDKLPFVRIKNTLMPVYDVRHAIQWPNGNRISLSINATPVLNAQGNFNGMIATIEDITEKLKVEKQLQETNEQLHELNRTKDRFFSIIAHDLRGSLGNITNLSELLYIDFKTNKAAQDESMAKAIYDGSLNTLNLLENLLSWANSQRHTVSMVKTKTDISALLKECTMVLSGLAIDKQITVTFDLDASITCDTDRDMLSTIVRNLVSNAIKYSYPQSEVTVTLRLVEQGSFVEISVSDKGLGMDDDTKNNLFASDQHTSTKGTTGEGGSGLGLVLCREFINKLGGSISIESQLGKGSLFCVRLPYRNS